MFEAGKAGQELLQCATQKQIIIIISGTQWQLRQESFTSRQWTKKYL